MSSIRNLILILSAVALTLAFPEEADERILNGVPAKAFTYPYQVAIMKTIRMSTGRQGIGQFCGGVILNPNWILTAAHCFENVFEPGNGKYSVHAGSLSSIDASLYSQLETIQQAYCHPGYNSTTIANDICLLKLVKPLKESIGIRSISLPPADFEATGDGLILGWGATKSNEGKSVVKLHVAGISVSPKSVCEKVYPETPITDDHICLGGNVGTSACGGDSGGPFVQYAPPTHKPIVVGVTSFGGVECSDKNPVVYTRVVSFLEWIEETLKK